MNAGATRASTVLAALTAQMATLILMRLCVNASLAGKASCAMSIPTSA
jgi:hypothetical protein